MNPEKFEISNDNEIDKTELLNENAQYEYGKNFEELTPYKKIKIINDLLYENPEEAYIKTDDKKELMNLGIGLGSMSSIAREVWSNKPSLFWGSLKDKTYTDGRIIVLDEKISMKLLEKESNHYIDKHIKKHKLELNYETKLYENRSYSDAKKIIDLKIREEIDKVKFSPKKFLQEQGSKFLINENPINENMVELKEVGFVVYNSIIFTNPENTNFVAIDGRYYIGLSREWKNPIFYTNNSCSTVTLSSMGEAKAIIFPIKIVEDYPPYNKLIKESQKRT